MAAKNEHPLQNILINVLLPVLVLSYLSKDPELLRQLGKTVRPWHIGPAKALTVALALPLGYGIWHFAKTQKTNFFSALGLVSVLLTGGLTMYLWNKDGTVKPHADILFGLKEASIPCMLGIAVIGSHFTKQPLLRTFLYSDSLFNIAAIEREVNAKGEQAHYGKLLLRATQLFATSFFLSTLLNFGLAMFFLHGFDHAAADAREIFNARIAKITGWGFAVIGVPMMGFLFLTLHQLVAGLRRITGMKDEEIMMPR